jgi:hypothetical protein
VSILPEEDQEEDHAPVHCYDHLKNYPQSLENTNTSGRCSRCSYDHLPAYEGGQEDAHMIILKKAQNSNDSDNLENNFKMIKTVNDPLDPLPPTPSPPLFSPNATVPN